MFHWFVIVEMLVEFVRVLVLGGWLGLIWNWCDMMQLLHCELGALMVLYWCGAFEYVSDVWCMVFFFGVLFVFVFEHCVVNV